MSGARFIGLIAATDLQSLASWRAVGWDLCAAAADRWWLRVPQDDEAVFMKLPLAGRWHEDADGLMTRLGKRVPEQTAPATGWVPLATLLPVGPPRRGAVAMPPVPVAWSLEADDADRPAEALMCRWPDFMAWALAAFAPRLECLSFARCDDDRVFVTGHPLPPVRGQGYHRAGRLWLPGGHRLPSHVWPELLEERLRLGTSRFALLHPDGSHEEMAEENFVRASRAAVRLTEGDPVSFETP
ncbi:hypothetical protein [Luteolibacter sp. LG18]|uniref:hypothetical protein n=1 Tax=Luteolibacter sp. LG18 TaxID=2819286 RepID=UPI002B31F3EB|nr:hypothetical protein llg_18390 [Luteolibacter sp. LG18]